MEKNLPKKEKLTPSYNMKVGIFADGIWGLNLIKILYSDKNFKIDFVVLRNQIDLNILHFCQKKKINQYSFKNINNKKSIETLKKFKSNILVSMSYNQIFKNNFLKCFRKKIINCHAGALPYYRGRSPINWAIINGENKIGITTHLISSKIDKGDILDQKFIKIQKNDNFKTILKKCYIVCPMQLHTVLKKIKNQNIKSFKQSVISKKGSYFFKRKKGDEVINFNNNFKDLNNFIKGLVFPSVGATFTYKRKLYLVINSILSKKKNKGNEIKNGTILSVTKNNLKVKIQNSVIVLNNLYIKSNKTCVNDLRKIFKNNSLLIGSNV